MQVMQVMPNVRVCRLHSPVHPNDHCNMGQSSNDTFPTVMHIAAVEQIERGTMAALEGLRAALETKARAFELNSWD